MKLQKLVCRLSALALGLSAAAAPALAAGVWLSGVDPEAQKARHVTQPADYMDLFKTRRALGEGRVPPCRLQVRDAICPPFGRS
jgi:hypothetical protein